MKKITTIAVVVIALLLPSIQLNAQVTVATNFGNSGNYVGWNSAQAFPLKISHDGAQPINFWTNGSQRMTILANGNVGIGITNPTSIFQVAGLLNFDNTNNNTFWGYQTGNGNLTSTSSNKGFCSVCSS